MAHYSFAEIGITVNENDSELKKQFMDCIGFLGCIDSGEFGEHYPQVPHYDFEYDSLYDKDDMFYGSIDKKELHDIPAHQYYAILNLLFPKTYLFAQHMFGTSVTICWRAEQYLFDPVNNSVTRHFEGEDNDCVIEIHDWCRGSIRVNLYDENDCWVGEEEYSYSEFYRLSREKQQEIEENCPTCRWSGQMTEECFIEIDRECVREILDESVKKGYVELSALIMEKCKDYLKNK